MIQLYPHQRKAVEGLSDGKVLVGGVGTGKTITSLVYFFEKVMGGSEGDLGSIQTPMDLYIFTTARKRDELDWQREAAKLAITKDRELSVAGIKLTVDSYNNIKNYLGVKNAFIILDEQRMVGSGSWTKAFIKLAKTNRWIMLSATPGDRWEDYIPLFIANGYYKNRTEFKRKHCEYSYYGKFPKLERYLEVGRLVRLRNSILVEMPFERHTKRNVQTIPVEYDVETFRRVVKDRWHVYEQRPLKDVAELFSVMRRVVNSDSSRVTALRKLMKTKPRLIVFYNFDYELENLRLLANGCTCQDMEDEEWPIQRPVDTISLSSIGTTQATGPISAPVVESKLLQKSQRISDMCGTPNSPCGFTLQNENAQMDSKVKMPKTDEKLSEGNERSKLSSPVSESRFFTIAQERQTGKCSHTGTTFALAEWNGHKHEPVPDTDRWVYLVQYVAGSEAWNCTSTDSVVFYSLTYSYRNFEQAQGRIDRLDTPFLNLNYYVLMSNSAIDRAIAKALKSKKNFNEREQGVYTYV